MTAEWKIEYEVEVPGARHNLEVGAEFRLHGERGKRYNFIRFVTNAEGSSWVDCYGGSRSKQGSRSVPLDLVAPDSVKPPKRKTAANG